MALAPATSSILCESVAPNENAWPPLCASTAGGETDADDTLDPSSFALLLLELELDSVALHKLCCECDDTSSWPLEGVSCMLDPLLSRRPCDVDRTADSGDITAEFECGDVCSSGIECMDACCACGCCIFAFEFECAVAASIHRG